MGGRQRHRKVALQDKSRTVGRILSHDFVPTFPGLAFYLATGIIWGGHRGTYYFYSLRFLCWEFNSCSMFSLVRPRSDSLEKCSQGLSIPFFLNTRIFWITAFSLFRFRGKYGFLCVSTFNDWRHLSYIKLRWKQCTSESDTLPHLS